MMTTRRLVILLTLLTTGCAVTSAPEGETTTDEVVGQSHQELKIGVGGGAGGGGLSFDSNACRNDCWSRFPDNFRRWNACMDHCDCVAEGRCIDL